MNRKTREKFEARARIIKSMGHPTRLFIVDELSRGERCVCELTDMIGADVSTVSKHLTVLRHSGIVQDEKRGSQVFYSLTVPCVLNFFDCVESVLKARIKKQMGMI
ncbi:winged helix-turn-helix transcriptional regulator [bacterium]|nr:winged helix-turn-helix transcriptional regulator [candidate division CSSED10-310 bacterium]